MKTVTLTPCVACNAELAETAKVCPHCGAERETKKEIKGRVFLSGAFYSVGVGIFSSIIFLMPHEKGEVPFLYFLPAILMITMFLLTRRLISSYENEQGVKYKDITSKIGTFFMFLPAWIVLFGVMIVPVDTFLKQVQQEGGIIGVFLFFSFFIAYIPFLKTMKYI